MITILRRPRPAVDHVAVDSARRAWLLGGGTLLSAGTGWLTSLGDGPDAVTFGLVVGLQSEILVLLLELLLTVHRRHVALGRAGALVTRVEQVPGLMARLDDVTERLQRIGAGFRDTVLPGEAERLLDRFQRHLQELSDGHVFHKAYDVTLKMRLLSAPAGSLRTTSLQSPDLELHLSEVGRSYWRAQEDALRRGWLIERTFIYDEWTDALDDLARAQAASGVVVRRVERRCVPEPLRGDFSIWSDRYSYQQWARRTDDLFEDRFSAAPLDLRRRQEMWAALTVAAEIFPDRPDSGTAPEAATGRPALP